MIDSRDWPFTKARAEDDARHYHISALYDWAVNYGSTEEAMIEVLTRLKSIQSATEVGCSVIPDCMGARGDIEQMFVVISCIYLEK